MKRKFLAMFISLCFICTGCNAEQMIKSGNENITSYADKINLSRDEQISNIKEKLENLKASYSQMLKEAAASAATKAGKKAAEIAADQLQKQIDKLDNINWDSLSDEEITKYSDTITNTLGEISTIREKIAGQ